MSWSVQGHLYVSGASQTWTFNSRTSLEIKYKEAPNHHILCLDTNPSWSHITLTEFWRDTCDYHFRRSLLRSAAVLRLQAGVTIHITDVRHNFNPVTWITPKSSKFQPSHYTHLRARSMQKSKYRSCHTWKSFRCSSNSMLCLYTTHEGNICQQLSCSWIVHLRDTPFPTTNDKPHLLLH